MCRGRADAQGPVQGSSWLRLSKEKQSQESCFSMLGPGPRPAGPRNSEGGWWSGTGQDCSQNNSLFGPVFWFFIA